MVNFKYIGLPLLLGNVGRILAACTFNYDVDTGTCEGTTECDGFHLSGNKLIEYKYDATNPTCKVSLNPPPGYYKNASGDYIKCTNTECSNVEKPLSTECGETTDGQLISDSTDNIVKLCTKINNLVINEDKTLTLQNNKYAKIEFGESDDYYIVHHNEKSPFNFDTYVYYVVKKTANSINFYPKYEYGNANAKFEDYCATNGGMIIDRRTDFCSNNSSGMYYQCENGKCLSESQLNGEKEQIDDSFCNCKTKTDYTGYTCNFGYQGKMGEGESIEGIYELKDNKCTAMESPTIGYYRDGYHYSNFIYWDGENYKQYSMNVEVNTNSCSESAAGFIDNGYNALFCKDATSEPIPFQSITELFVKGIQDSGPFGAKDKYYALIKKDESLIVNKEKTGYYLDNKLLLSCTEGICSNIEEPKLGYYLNALDKSLINCVVNGAKTECTPETVKNNGYYFNAGSTNNVIQCNNSGCENINLTAASCEGQAYKIYYGSESAINYCNNEDAVPIEPFTATQYYEIPLSTTGEGGINYPTSIVGSASESIIVQLNQYSVVQYVSDQDICIDANHQKELSCSLENKKYSCKEKAKTCTFVTTTVCKPESQKSEERASCSGYYLSTARDLLLCSEKEGVVNCDKQSLTGYFLNSDLRSESSVYIICKKVTSGISCEGKAKPTATTCSASGDVILVEENYKLCLDSTTANAIDIFKSGITNEYFMPANLLATGVAQNKYYIAVVKENSVLAKTLTESDRRFRYTFSGYKILSFDKGQCNKGTGTAASDLIEYTLGEKGENVYIREN